MTSIEYGAFYGCENLTFVYYGGSAGQLDEISIDEGNDPLYDAAFRLVGIYAIDFSAASLTLDAGEDKAVSL